MQRLSAATAYDPAWPATVWAAAVWAASVWAASVWAASVWAASVWAACPDATLYADRAAAGETS